MLLQQRFLIFSIAFVCFVSHVPSVNALSRGSSGEVLYSIPIESYLYVVKPTDIKWNDKHRVELALSTLLSEIVQELQTDEELSQVKYVEDSIEIYSFGDCPDEITEFYHCFSPHFKYDIFVPLTATVDNSDDLNIYEQYYNAINTVLRDGSLEQVIRIMDSETSMRVLDVLPPPIQFSELLISSSDLSTRGDFDEIDKLSSTTTEAPDGEEVSTPWYLNAKMYVIGGCILGFMLGICCYGVALGSKKLAEKAHLDEFVHNHSYVYKKKPNRHQMEGDLDPTEVDMTEHA